MKIPKQARREGKELFRSVLVNGRLDPAKVRMAVQQVAALKPRGFLAVLSHFERLVKLELQRRTATVETAVPLSPELQQNVRGNLSRAYGEGLEFNFVQNPALIGGMRIKVGSDVYDGSVQGRLASLEEAF